MAPATALDWSEPCQHWRYPKLCPSGQAKNEKAKSAMELSGKEANSAYKKFCKFLRRLGNKKRECLRWLYVLVGRPIYGRVCGMMGIRGFC